MRLYIGPVVFYKRFKAILHLSSDDFMCVDKYIDGISLPDFQTIFQMFCLFSFLVALEIQPSAWNKLPLSHTELSQLKNTSWIIF